MKGMRARKGRCRKSRTERLGEALAKGQGRAEVTERDAAGSTSCLLGCEARKHGKHGRTGAQWNRVPVTGS